MDTNLYIPKKIHVGFQERTDTFTGKLAYVIYEDEKGVLRKQTSWDGWRDKKIKTQVFDNTPKNGFVFNKGVQRYGHFGSGRSVIRVYDDRDFEFEISVDNLIGILMHSDVSKRDIVEECVFAWSGKDLILLPVNSEEYRASVEYTNKQSLKISAKELVKGHVYGKKKSEGDLVYMGHENFYETNYSRFLRRGKKHIFFDLESKEFVTPTIATLSHVKLAEVHPEFAQYDKKLHNSVHLNDWKKIIVKKIKKTNQYYNYHFKERDENSFYAMSVSRYHQSDKDVVNPESLYFSVFSVNHEKDYIEVHQENLSSYHDHQENVDVIKLMEFFNELFKRHQLDWTLSGKKDSYYYGRNNYVQLTLKGSFISIKQFNEMLDTEGFGNVIAGVSTQEKTFTLYGD